MQSLVAFLVLQKQKASCFALIRFLMFFEYLCSVVFPHDAVGSPAVWDFGILTFLQLNTHSLTYSFILKVQHDLQVSSMNRLI